MDSRRFFIFGLRRTGSTLLVSLLDSHPNIRCYSELFYQGRWKVHVRKFLKPLAFRYPMLYLNWVCAIAFRPVVGFKLMVHHDEELNNLMEKLVQRNWRVISIRRRDVIHRVLSEAVLFTTRIPHSYGSSRQYHEKIHIDESLFRKLLEENNRLERRETELLAKVPHISIVYEDDLANPQQWPQATKRILEFLDVPAIPLSTRMVRTWETPYEQFVENYAKLVDIASSYNTNRSDNLQNQAN